MTQVNDLDPDKTMNTARVINEIAEAQKAIDGMLERGAMKTAPFKMVLNGIDIISNDAIPEGIIVVPKAFADLLYTTCLESEGFKVA